MAEMRLGQSAHALPAYPFLVDSFRKSEKNQKRISSGSSPVYTMFLRVVIV